MQNTTMICLFTDFGLEGPYVGQVMAVIKHLAPTASVVNLFADAPRFDALASACLLQAYIVDCPAPCICLGVVDPGVGTTRRGLIVEADDRCFVGPDNGLFDRVMASAADVRCWEIDYRPERLSRTFHGRDIFAPVAARLATGCSPTDLGHEVECPVPAVTGDLERIVYIDHYGNGMTGITAERLSPDRCLLVNGHLLAHADTFAEVPVGRAFWYINANGLVELAVNQDSAAERLGLALGMPVRWSDAA